MCTKRLQSHILQFWEGDDGDICLSFSAVRLQEATTTLASNIIQVIVSVN